MTRWRQSFRAVLIGAGVSALILTGTVGAGHGPADSVNALHLGVYNGQSALAGQTDLDCSGDYCLDVWNMHANPYAAVTGRVTTTSQYHNGRIPMAVGGFNLTESAFGAGVRGYHHGSGVGVIGQARGVPAGGGVGVYGGTLSSVRGIGVLGNTLSGYGVAAVSQDTALLAYNPSLGEAGAFVGDVTVTGTLTKGAGAFRIDHPLDPANRYLQHSFVESPDMKNVYDGIVTTDKRGLATVRLPRYFGALNRDFRYQLTIVGRAGWDVAARVWREIERNRFVIRTNRGGIKVSWQVTGIRKDRYANAHRIDPEPAKTAPEQGRFVSPELYGKSQSQSIVKLDLPAAARARP